MLRSSKTTSATTKTRALQWLSLIGIVWLQSINGTNTNFPAYSSQLKASLSLSQLQLNNLAFASDAGKLLAWLSGLAALYLPLWLVLAIGSSLGLLGYGLQFLSLAHHPHGHPVINLAYWQLFLLTLLAGNSICWINTVSYVVIIRNFPARYRQVAIGLTTSYQGLSAKIYTDIAGSLTNIITNNAEAFLLLNSALPPLVCLVTAPAVRALGIDNELSKMDAGFVAMFAVTVLTGIYSVASSLGWCLSGNKSAAGVAVFLLAPLVIPAAARAREGLENRKKRVYSFAETNNTSDGDSDSAVVVVGVEEEVKLGDECVREEIGVREMVVRGDFWLYFAVYFTSATVGMVYLNNLGQIAESRGCLRTSSLVSLSSSFGFFGRLVPSLLDYHFSRSNYRVSRPGMMAMLVAPTAGAFFLLLNPTNQALYVSTAVIGVCTGAITSISVSMTSELFGTENFSVNHNVLVANIPIGSLVFGYMAAMIYHKEGKGLLNGKCMGIECYRSTFLVWGCIGLLGTVFALILYVRTKKFYSRIR